MTMISDSVMLDELAAEFPGYAFSTQRTWEGVSLIAVRQQGSARSGLYVVITPDLRRDAPDPARGRELRSVAEGQPAIDVRGAHGQGVH